MHEVISVKNGITRMSEWRLAEPVNFVLMITNILLLLVKMVAANQC